MSGGAWEGVCGCESGHKIRLKKVKLERDAGGGPKHLHLKPGHLKMAFFSARPGRRFPCLDGPFPV